VGFHCALEKMLQVNSHEPQEEILVEQVYLYVGEHLGKKRRRLRAVQEQQQQQEEQQEEQQQQQEEQQQHREHFHVVYLYQPLLLQRLQILDDVLNYAVYFLRPLLYLLEKLH
jgi:hypothetical protein